MEDENGSIYNLLTEGQLTIIEGTQTFLKVSLILQLQFKSQTLNQTVIWYLLISLCFPAVTACCYNFCVPRPFVPTLISQPRSLLVAHTVQNTHRNGACPSSLVTLNMGWDKHVFHWRRCQWWRKHIHQIVALRRIFCHTSNLS